MKQQSFIPNQKSFFKGFGGSLLKNGNAKVKRPVSDKSPMHMTVRSTQAKGKLSFRYGKNHRDVNALVRQACRKHGVKLYEYANVGNHLHLVLKLHKRFLWTPFIRELTGKLRMLIVGFQELELPFFDQRPFTRIINGWTKAYRAAKDYVVLNQMEAAGIITRKVIPKDFVQSTA